MGYVSSRNQPSVMAMARAGHPRAIADWLNTVLLPLDIHAEVLTAPANDRAGGGLNILIEFHSGRIRDPKSPEFCKQMIRLMGHRIWQLNSEIIHQVQIAARYIDQPGILWHQELQIVPRSKRSRLGKPEMAPPSVRAGNFNPRRPGNHTYTPPQPPPPPPYATAAQSVYEPRPPQSPNPQAAKPQTARPQTARPQAATTQTARPQAARPQTVDTQANPISDRRSASSPSSAPHRYASNSAPDPGRPRYASNSYASNSTPNYLQTLRTRSQASKSRGQTAYSETAYSETASSEPQPQPPRSAPRTVRNTASQTPDRPPQSPSARHPHPHTASARSAARPTASQPFREPPIAETFTARPFRTDRPTAPDRPTPSDRPETPVRSWRDLMEELPAPRPRPARRSVPPWRAPSFQTIRTLILSGLAPVAFILGCGIGFIDLIALPLRAFTPAKADRPTERPAEVTTALEEKVAVETIEPKTVDGEATLFLGGDVTLSDSYTKIVGNDRQWSFAALEESRRADLAIVNLEAPFTTANLPQPDRPIPFKADPANVEVLQRGGIDLVNLANNHTMDYQKAGLEETLKVLEQAGIRSLGAGLDARAARRPRILDVDGQRIAYFAYHDADGQVAGEKNAGINPQQNDQIAADIKAVRDQVDWVIVHYHWGENLAKQLGNWQTELAHFTIDQGADLVVGHHSTILQGGEIYKDRPIVYSLGNFIFGGRVESDYETVALKVALKENQMKVEMLPIEVKGFQPKIAQGERGQAILDDFQATTGNLRQPLKSAIVLETRPTQVATKVNSTAAPSPSASPAPTEATPSAAPSVSASPSASASPDPAPSAPTQPTFSPDIPPANSPSPSPAPLQVSPMPTVSVAPEASPIAPPIAPVSPTVPEFAPSPDPNAIGAPLPVMPISPLPTDSFAPQPYTPQAPMPYPDPTLGNGGYPTTPVVPQPEYFAAPPVTTPPVTPP